MLSHTRDNWKVSQPARRRVQGLKPVPVPVVAKMAGVQEQVAAGEVQEQAREHRQSQLVERG